MNWITNAVRSIWNFLDILPLDVWRTMDDWLAKRYHLLDVLTGDMPQTLIAEKP
jgi:haloacetate dehalogenase